MRRPLIKQLLPSTIEVGYIALVVCAILLLGNGKLILERIGFISSADLIGQQVSTKATTGLLALDSFRFTANAVDLMLWGATGLIIYSALQSVVRIMRIVAYERDFDSIRYVHPWDFTHRGYWRQVIKDTVLGFALLVALAIVSVLYIVVALPGSFAFIHRFILHPGILTLADGLLGFVATLAATTILYVFIKLVINHHRIAYDAL
jgi:uncharacterized BrkB/YihY/UPF0761 family membrane protein